MKRARLLLSIFIINASLFHAYAANVSVKGFGLFGNAELKAALKLLELDEEAIPAQQIDDAAFLLLTRLTQNGYLDASVHAEYTTVSGQEGSATWSAPFESQISDGVSATKLKYEVKPGILYHYNSVEIEGLQSIDTEEATTYIIPDSTLITRKKDRSYSDSILSTHRNALASALAALGRIDAKVTATSVEIDEESGGVDVVLSVDEGPLYRITKADIQFKEGESVSRTESLASDTVYTRTWIEDRVQELRNASYKLGYPETKITSRIAKATPRGENMAIEMLFEVERGSQYNLSSIEHRGADDTHLPLLDRKSDLDIGGPLDITEAEAARRKISRLGIFRRIDLSYEDDGIDQRKAVYTYTNGERVETHLLFGFGSYEQFRAGLLARRENILGRAHSLSFSAIKSVKSLTGEIDYTVPELFGEAVSGTFEINYLDRQEITFDRKERGMALGLFRSFPEHNLDLGIDYAFDQKESTNPEHAEQLRYEETDIGSISLRSTRSTVDNLLYPKNGYALSGAIRFANESLGGETQFIRTELSGAYHKQLGNRWLFHIGAKGGNIDSSRVNALEIPFGERFLIGGDNSIRGYRRGEAGPLDESGDPIGVERYALLNLEFEYPIMDQLNIVFFTDVARVWESSEDSSVYDDLASAGLGFRYNTIIGPVRLEYGHNIDPRREDPKGTLHLSIGFPF